MDQHPEHRPLRVAITGSSGFIGKHLTDHMHLRGVDVVRLVRGRPNSGEVGWNPDNGELGAQGAWDAVVHLAGKSVAEGRWTVARREAIRSSRVDATRRLCESLVRLPQPPKTLICASAIGFYGDRGEAIVDENAARGAGFLADVCVDWENACAPAKAAGMRVVHARFGMVLSPDGGALAAMLPFFRLGLGGRIGGGRQWLSWITLDDALGALQHFLTSDVHGPVNIVTPHPIRQADFAVMLAAALRRPRLAPMPAFAVKALFGRKGEELLLASCRVEPSILRQQAFRFAAPDAAVALRRALGV